MPDREASFIVKRVVIDTNVLVSSMLSSEGNSARIMNLISDKQIQLFYCPAIMDEYKRVLAYEKLSITTQTQRSVVNAIEELGIMIKPAAGDIPLPDESDRVFYDTARISGSILITGNIKHYPTEAFVMTPTAFLTAYEKGGAHA